MQKKLCSIFMFGLLIMTSQQLLADDEYYEVRQPAANFLKKSDLLSPDLRNGFIAHPELLYKLSLSLSDVCYLAAYRPDPALVDEALSHLNDGKISPSDFLIAWFCALTYGEAALVDGAVKQLGSEPTGRTRGRFEIRFLDEKDFESALTIIRSIIDDVGRRMGWGWEKIRDTMISSLFL